MRKNSDTGKASPINVRSLLWKYQYPDDVMRRRIDEHYAQILPRMHSILENMPCLAFASPIHSLDAILENWYKLLNCEFGRQVPDDFGSLSNERKGMERLKTILPSILGEQGIEILDAGSGFGSDAILFGLLGANVLGVELFPGHVEFALRRLSYYEDLFDEKGKDILGAYASPKSATGTVEFTNQNVLNLRTERRFDIIWSNESIEHIHPLDEFFQVCYDHLREGGRLIICNGNGFSPYVQLKLILKRGFRLYVNGKYRDPVSGEFVRYAMERVLPYFRTTRMLKLSGFYIENMKFIGFVPSPMVKSELAYSLSQKVDEIMVNLPVMSRLSQAYVVTARK